MANRVFEPCLDAQKLIMIEFTNILDLMVDEIPFKLPLTLKQSFLKCLPLKLTQIFLLKLFIEPENVDVEIVGVFPRH